ncbi:MAG: hypothetical protein EBT90_08035 [Rhodobacteraceae bacterium]|nr:hypothetical protein [Paracoccaceae bacterium]
MTHFLSLHKRLFATFSRFYSDQTGAISVDWIVLVAGATALAIGAFMSIGSGLNDSFIENESENELVYVMRSFAEESGGIEAPERSLVGSLVHTVRLKVLLSSACIGMRLTYRGNTFLGERPQEYFCRRL